MIVSVGAAGATVSIVAVMFSAVISNNIVLSQYQGICPFLGVSKKMSSAVGMGFAVIFVLAVSSVFCWLVYNFILLPLELDYLYTMAFILVIASLVQVLEIVLKRFSPTLYSALGIYLPLITTNLRHPRRGKQCGRVPELQLFVHLLFLRRDGHRVFARDRPPCGRAVQDGQSGYSPSVFKGVSPSR